MSKGCPSKRMVVTSLRRMGPGPVAMLEDQATRQTLPRSMYARLELAMISSLLWRNDLNAGRLVIVAGSEFRYLRGSSANPVPNRDIRINGDIEEASRCSCGDAAIGTVVPYDKCCGFLRYAEDAYHKAVG
jgi:hypothetical protein